MSVLIFIILIYMGFFNAENLLGFFFIYLITVLHFMTGCNREHIFNMLYKFMSSLVLNVLSMQTRNEEHLIKSSTKSDPSE